MLTLLILGLIILFVLYSFGRGMDALEDTWKNRKITEPCPYCGSMEHRKDYHVPK